MEEKTMDPLVRKAEMMENNRLRMDDRLKFACDNCGGCCRNQEELIMSPYDIFRMAEHLHLTMKEWFDLYGRVHIGSDSRLPIVRIKLIGETERCPFLKDNRCSLHRIKPDICALYPLGRGVSYSEDGSDAEKKEVVYFHSGCQCGKEDDGSQTVQEWLDGFHLRDREDYFCRWTEVVKEAALKIRKMEEDGEDQDVVEGARVMVFMLLYVNYSMKEDFEKQFEANVRELEDNLDAFIRTVKLQKNENRSVSG